ncbi:GNAT family N-acetyltransferase [Cytobacillus sp. Sa5YUA1]|uniref:GNAT family N-acetyltransferase n=1 Tax=Cytobacillus stercorigallinarum TaxID=2762240 RepID=A0ABR8QU76_9BACI|nr:GNAT family N-acetyltransferase [Cytobacillus stercorigallinarum]MBD7938982.1 GNAT family N-acetyltransferase [Cytobacillus stercorigallinarum]
MIPQKLTHQDIDGIIRLSQSVGWDYDQAEVTTILNSGKVFGHKNKAGEVVASAAIMPYGERVASIGMVIVHENYRGKGLAMTLMKECIGQVDEQTIIQLIATAYGQPLYEKIGFQMAGAVKKLIAPTHFLNDHTLIFSPQVVPYQQEKDFQEVIALDERAFGANRTQFLSERIKQSKDCLVLKNKEGKITGYGLSIFGPVYTILGPIVAPDTQSAFQIISQLKKREGKGVRIDILARQGELQELLVAAGFELINEPPMMMLHSNSIPSRTNQLFAIASQAFG